MIGKLLAGFIGSKIDRSDGEGGVKGALIGVAVERVIKRMGPIGWVLMILFLTLRFVWRLFFPKRKVRHARY